MGFDKKKSKGNDKPKKSNGSDKEKVYRKIGSIWESQHFDGCNFTGDDYSGDLIFRDKETGKFYKVKGGSLFDPKPGAPKNLVYNLVINLNNEYDVEEMGEDEGASEESEEEPG